MKVGDTLDLLMGEDKEAETETVMQILLKKKKKCLKRRPAVRNTE